MPLREGGASIAQRKELPERCVSLTVDDAYISVYQNAYPRLKSLNWPLTVFVNTAGDDQGIAAYMSWDQMREMSKHGVSFENHGHGHIHQIRKIKNETDDAWYKRVARDIQIAQQRITAEIGRAPRLYAHPFGEYNQDTLTIIRHMGLTGFGQQSGPVWPDANFGALPRFPMAARYADMPGFKTKVNTLALPVISAEPGEPLVPLQQWRPVLTVTLAQGHNANSTLQCFVSGSNDVELSWSKQRPGQFTVKPNFDLKPGRSRTNCTMPSKQRGRYYWYSHNWFVRNADGSWYPEY